MAGPELKWEEKLAAARLMAMKKWPWFRAALLSLIPYEAKGFGSIGVTHGGVLIIDPDKVKEWSVSILSGVVIHETLHILRAHHERAYAMGINVENRHEHQYEKLLWNYAADMEINDDLKEANCALPEFAVYPERYKYDDGLTAEEYYQLLRKKHDPERDKMQQMIEQMLKYAEGSNGGDGDGDDDNQQDKSGGGKDNKQQKPDICNGFCGSGAGGLTLPREQKAHKEAGTTRSKLDKEMMRKQTAAAINEAAQHGRGNIPGDLQRWAETELAPPKVNWREKLRRACRQYVARTSGAVDLAFHKPSRRQGGLGYGSGKAVLPAYFAPVPRVAVIVDTSGSMGSEELQTAVEESAGILRAANAQVTFAALDAEVQSFKKVTRPQELVQLLKGGGGTDFCPGFEAIQRIPKHDRPQTLVFITDGIGPAPAVKPPDLHVIWVLVGRCRQIPWAVNDSDDYHFNSSKTITWGSFIEIDDDGTTKIHQEA